VLPASYAEPHMSKLASVTDRLAQLAAMLAAARRQHSLGQTGSFVERRASEKTPCVFTGG